ncbi:MAG TPA: PhoH family protein, partial [Lamprocystis sp. (in: g-proteobacteria)]|nr:PhoH family protein [Lamprocystis sp. (in: g-proteobacteria)]
MSTQPQSLDLELTPADNARLSNLCGPFEQHLRQIERRLGIEISNRGVSFRLIGEAAAVRLGDLLLRGLFDDTAVAALTPESIHLALRELGADDLAAASAERLPELTIKTKRGLIKARGPNQQEYLHAIARHDISFGVGPAGTGKTYLAVASAVEALETDRVRRLLLVRPAVEAG